MRATLTVIVLLSLSACKTSGRRPASEADRGTTALTCGSYSITGHLWGEIHDYFAQTIEQSVLACSNSVAGFTEDDEDFRARERSMSFRDLQEAYRGSLDRLSEIETRACGASTPEFEAQRTSCIRALARGRVRRGVPASDTRDYSTTTSRHVYLTARMAQERLRRTRDHLIATMGSVGLRTGAREGDQVVRGEQAREVLIAVRSALRALWKNQRHFYATAAQQDRGAKLARSMETLERGIRRQCQGQDGVWDQDIDSSTAAEQGEYEDDSAVGY